MMVWAGALVGLLLLGGVLAGWRTLSPYLFLWRQFAETAQERRDRKFRVALAVSDELASDGPPRFALVWARRAYRIRPEHPVALLNLGIVLNRMGHHERALNVLESAHREQSGGRYVGCTADGFVTTVAHEAMRAACVLRGEARDDVGREAWGEVALHWVKLAIQEDPELAVELPDMPELRDLAPAARMMLQTTQTEARDHHAN